jgi:hypothetical protein
VTRVHIRTDDEVYRVDAVWLGPPRATFPWRARYSAYGVGLLVMIAVMFVQRRLGIDLGFFSVAWALLITVVVTRFVSRRINDERPLLEWLTLFVHELKGPRARSRGVGGALTTGHVTVRRDRPRALGPATAVALPRGSSTRAAATTWGPPPEDARRTPVPRRAPGTPARRAPTHGDVGPDARRARRRPAAPGSAAAATATDTPTPGHPTHLTPDLDDAGPSHAPRRPRQRGGRDGRGTRRVPATRAVADAGFGPPSSADVGPGGTPRADPPGVDVPYRPAVPELPPAATPSAASEVAGWAARREPRPVRVRPVDPHAEQGPFGPGSRSPRGGA